MKVYTQEVARDIIDTFEDVLNEHCISIPDDNRTGDCDEAAIYGETYDWMLASIGHKIGHLMEALGIEYKEGIWNSSHGNDWFGE